VPRPAGTAVVESFPARALAQAPGAGTERRMPLSHASRWFDRNHAAVASSQPESCGACHTRTFCTDCHDAPATPGYHPRNFALQHSAAAYSQRLECSTCHEVRTFCRACHVQQGMDAVGRLGPGFHDAEPLWLLRTRAPPARAWRAAPPATRSGTACSATPRSGSFQVNPHGPNFDARRAYSRNPVICSACHVGDPINGRSRRDESHGRPRPGRRGRTGRMPPGHPGDQRTETVTPSTVEQASAGWPEGLGAVIDSANAAYSAGDYETPARSTAGDAAGAGCDGGWFGIYMAEHARGNIEAADSAMQRARALAPEASLIHGAPGDTLPPGHP
jgi:hypothetical protein